MRSRPIVAIDGPSGAGKTTAARRLAQRASLTRLDTGAMYRACALAARRAGVSWSDGPGVGRLCASLAIAFRGAGDAMRITLSGEDVSDLIRTPEMDAGSSEVSVHAAVREAMVALQRKMGEEGGVVLEGRDTGTVVFPDAEVKFFLDGCVAVRAQRRRLERPGPEGTTFEDILREVLRRDVRDSTREHSPLRIAEDAVYIDSTVLSVDEVVEVMMRRIPSPAGRSGQGKKT
jgi:cytidylate kinase